MNPLLVLWLSGMFAGAGVTFALLAVIASVRGGKEKSDDRDV